MCSLGGLNSTHNGQRPGIKEQSYNCSKYFQEFLFCGPREENCVANRTIEDASCLVPCTGLYADIADDSLRETMLALDHSLKEKVIKGNVDSITNVSPTALSSGFQRLNKQMYDKTGYPRYSSIDWQYEDKELFADGLQQIFPSSTFEGDEQVKALTEAYYKYKNKYVKHLFFNPDNENLCEYFFTFQTLSNSSNDDGPRTSGGSVHLL